MFYNLTMKKSNFNLSESVSQSFEQYEQEFQGSVELEDLTFESICTNVHINGFNFLVQQLQLESDFYNVYVINWKPELEYLKEKSLQVSQNEIVTFINFAMGDLTTHSSLALGIISPKNEDIIILPTYLSDICLAYKKSSQEQINTFEEKYPLLIQ